MGKIDFSMYEIQAIKETSRIVEVEFYLRHIIKPKRHEAAARTWRRPRRAGGRQNFLEPVGMFTIFLPMFPKLKIRQHPVVLGPCDWSAGEHCANAQEQ
ncbi:hypothetical protein EVAR_18982_1 [Eumeta japonica]|uniref:Uncharacterized protein n=1 Tax=Eumeta variegata TaxID=151549 RepID=A0A4C1WXU4_EUMVA|nr:hypothetical protein EVAR_18982_1 [Eumeta japonica]